MLLSFEKKHILGKTAKVQADKYKMLRQKLKNEGKEEFKTDERNNKGHRDFRRDLSMISIDNSQKVVQSSSVKHGKPRSAWKENKNRQSAKISVMGAMNTLKSKGSNSFLGAQEDFDASNIHKSRSPENISRANNRQSSKISVTGAMTSLTSKGSSSCLGDFEEFHASDIQKSRSTENIYRINNRQSAKISVSGAMTSRISNGSSSFLGALEDFDASDIHKSRSAENIYKINDPLQPLVNKSAGYLSNGRKSQLKKCIHADVSPITNRKSYQTPEFPTLPRILQLRLNERRRSRSLQDLSTLQRAALEQTFSNSSFLSEWSDHWRLARKGTLRKREGLPSIQGFMDHTVYAQTGLENNRDDDEISNRLESRQSSHPGPSLEERLEMIERKQGIQHFRF